MQRQIHSGLAPSGSLFANAVALHRGGRLREAEALYRAVLKRDANNFDALYHLGRLFIDEQDYEPAARQLRRAVNQRPAAAEARHHLAVALLRLFRHDEAIKHFERAAALSAGQARAEALNNMGVAFEEIGRIEEAREAFRAAIALAPRRFKYYRNLFVATRVGADDPHFAALQAFAGDAASFPEEEQIELHFALGKALADLDAHAQSFAHFVAGNALKRRQIPYREADMLGMLDTVRQIFTPDLLRRGAGAGNPSPAPIFIVGMPRSGTSLVEQILASHPQVFGAGERQDFVAALAKSRADRIEPIPMMEGPEFRAIGTDYLARLTGAAPRAARITDKMPFNFKFLGLIHLALPNARIIHVRRDPLDTCLSCFSVLFTADLHFAHDLGELGRFYRAYATIMEHWRNLLPAGVMLEVDYEAVVADPEPAMRRILAHCGLEWDEACLAFHQTARPVRTASMAQVRQPIYRSSVGRWQPYRDQLRPLFDALGLEPEAAPTGSGL